MCRLLFRTVVKTTCEEVGEACCLVLMYCTSWPKARNLRQNRNYSTCTVKKGQEKERKNLPINFHAVFRRTSVPTGEKGRGNKLHQNVLFTHSLLLYKYKLTD